jgi:hypothetical protein
VYLGSGRSHEARGGGLSTASSGMRRQLLESVRLVLTSEPAALGGPSTTPDDLVGDIRGTVSVTVGNIVMRLNRLGFTMSDRLYVIRDDLAAGRPIHLEDLQWLDMVIAREAADCLDEREDFPHSAA